MVLTVGELSFSPYGTVKTCQPEQFNQLSLIGIGKT